MNKKNLLISFIVCLAVIVTWQLMVYRAPSTSSPKTSPSHLSHLELSRVDFSQLSHLIVSAFDGNVKLCNYTNEQVFQLPQRLKSLTDDRYNMEKKLYQSLSLNERLDYIPDNCAVECSCNYYIGFYDVIEPEIKLTSEEKNKFLNLNQQLELQSKELPLCLKNKDWFCDSIIAKSLFQ